MAGTAPRRVLSPHLQIYRLPAGAWISILHRFTGLMAVAALGTATVLLWRLAVGAELPGWARGPAGSVITSAAVFALAFHWAAGLRHLLLDLGPGFTPPWPQRTAWMVPAAAVLATGLVWLP